MPLASLASLQWNGPAAGAMTGTGVASGAATLSGVGSMSAAVTATASGFLKATRLKNSPLIATATASGVVGDMKARARMSMHGKVNELSQDDVAGAILDAPIEGQYTLRQLMRIMSASLAGKVAVSGSTVTFRDVNDIANRIVSTTDSNGQRTAVTLDS